jgi:hypothetical protein
MERIANAHPSDAAKIRHVSAKLIKPVVVVEEEGQALRWGLKPRARAAV